MATIIETIITGGVGGGANNFNQLLDCPSTYLDQSGKFVRVKSTEDGLEFVNSTASVSFADILGNATDNTSLSTALGGKENTITAGTTGQYYRGDKTFQTLDKTAVGLGNVDNTSDLTKNQATATFLNKTIDCGVW